MIKNIEFKVGLYIVLSIAIIVSSLVYIAYKKDFLTDMNVYHLTIASADGVIEGMPVVFSGFEIGKITEVKLTPSGTVTVDIRVPKEHTKWVRKNSRFIFSKPLIGTPKIVVETNGSSFPMMPNRESAKIETADSINDAIAKAKPIMERVDSITSNLEKITSTLSSKSSLVSMATGNDSSGADIAEMIKSAKKSTDRLEKLLEKTDKSMFEENGIAKQSKDIVVNINKNLENIKKITANAAEASNDLAPLMKEIDLALKSTNDLLVEIDGKIPFKEKKEIKLP
jgi:phospholipid/cholesterol/gamma-HCH transport system substrate-binding protein